MGIFLILKITVNFKTITIKLPTTDIRVVHYLLSHDLSVLILKNFEKYVCTCICVGREMNELRKNEVKK